MWLSVLVAVAVVVLVVKRFLGEPLVARDLLVPPVVLVAVGGYAVVRAGPVSVREVVWVVGSALAGMVLGAVRGGTVRLFVRNGALWQRYSAWTIVAWAASIAVGAGLGWLAVRGGVRAEVRPVTLSVGVSLLGELVTLGGRTWVRTAATV
ncbi:DUF1453 family protein [Virgisporangium aurantiacum]|uniref:DUF1453 domain-containing protein n=1 Tax=Virgisporangium aurantiacum TaxID=175570 RepID=A0A8J3ZG17_9ACTN|nr:DUF1453 family protein [Virgisporangium aurantiacum]GIJ60935.1 hypothetical protein Vau01_084510 [Virgisporangium aurantiacum]